MNISILYKYLLIQSIRMIICCSTQYVLSPGSILDQAPLPPGILNPGLIPDSIAPPPGLPLPILNTSAAAASSHAMQFMFMTPSMQGHFEQMFNSSAAAAPSYTVPTTILVPCDTQGSWEQEASDELRRKCYWLEGQVQLLREQYHNLEDQKQKIHKDNQKLRKTAQHTERRAEGLLGVNKKLKEERQELEEKISQLEKQNAELEKAHVQNEGLNKELQEQNEGLNKELQEQKQELEAKISQLEKQNAELEKAHAEVQSKNDTLIVNSRKDQSIIQDFRSHVANLEVAQKIIRNQDATIQKLNEQIKMLKSNATSSSASSTSITIPAAPARRKLCNAPLHSLRKSPSTYQNDLPPIHELAAEEDRCAAAEQSTIEIKRNDKDQSIASLQLELAESKDPVDSFLKSIGDQYEPLMQGIRALASTMQIAHGQEAKLRADNTDLRMELQNMKTLTKSSEDKQQEIQDLKNQLQRLNEENTRLNKELIYLEDQSYDRGQEIQGLQRTLQCRGEPGTYRINLGGHNHRTVQIVKPESQSASSTAAYFNQQKEDLEPRVDTEASGPATQNVNIDAQRNATDPAQSLQAVNAELQHQNERISTLQIENEELRMKTKNIMAIKDDLQKQLNESEKMVQQLVAIIEQ